MASIPEGNGFSPLPDPDSDDDMAPTPVGPHSPGDDEEEDDEAVRGH